MSDGAPQGITSKRALKTILGGEPAPTDEEEQTREQVRERIADATPDSYEGATDAITRAMLRVLESRPETFDWSLNREGRWVSAIGEPLHGPVYTKDGEVDFSAMQYEALPGETLWDAAKDTATDDERTAFEDATGFMAGFAFNQARWLVGLEATGENPAIIEISGQS